MRKTKRGLTVELTSMINWVKSEIPVYQEQLDLAIIKANTDEINIKRANINKIKCKKNKLDNEKLQNNIEIKTANTLVKEADDMYEKQLRR